MSNKSIKDGFSAKIIKDSINPDYNRVTTFIVTYPRFMHSEVMTHRVFSRNSASSRAIPISKIQQQVYDNPATPVRWGKNGKGMQDHGPLDKIQSQVCATVWTAAAHASVGASKCLETLGLHKQIVNRVLEPFVWMTTLITATEWENFFALRLHKDAQPEFQYLAYLMAKEFLSHAPSFKNWGEWHIPFDDRMPDNIDLSDKLKVATARAARISYLTMDGAIDIDKDKSLHDSLLQNKHMSPFEHACVASKTFKGNLVGWNQYRHTVSGNTILSTTGLRELTKAYEKDFPEMAVKSIPVGIE